MKFFTDCTTQEEAKKLYHKLAKLFHPDKGGDNEMMIELKKQYDAWDSHSYQNTPSGYQFNTIYTDRFDRPLAKENFNLKNQVASLLTKIKWLNDDLLKWERKEEDWLKFSQAMNERLTNALVDIEFWKNKFQKAEEVAKFWYKCCLWGIIILILNWLI